MTFEQLLQEVNKITVIPLTREQLVKELKFLEEEGLVQKVVCEVTQEENWYLTFLPPSAETEH